MFKKWVVFSLIPMGNKRQIIITQEEISGREIVEGESKGEKIKEHLEDEFNERNLGENFVE